MCEMEELYQWKIKKMFEEQQQEIKRLHSIINKAREYINKNGIIDLNGYDLLEILQGSDKE